MVLPLLSQPGCPAVQAVSALCKGCCMASRIGEREELMNITKNSSAKNKEQKGKEDEETVANAALPMRERIKVYSTFFFLSRW